MIAYNRGGMAVELLVNFNEFWTRLREDIADAKESVFIQTFAFEGDSVGKQLAAALLSSPAADKRILADSFTRIVLSDRFRYAPANLFDRKLRLEARETELMRAQLESAGVAIAFSNPYGASPRKLLSRNHKKLILIDARAAYIGGINFSEHNAAWHDLMFRLDDIDAVGFLREDFVCSWDGRDRLAQHAGRDGELLTLDGRDNRRAFQRILELIDGARQTIFVESPYITFPFYERLRAAALRGVEVRIVTPEQNNWRLFRNYARLESARSGIDLRLYRDGMSHLKAMLIDDEYLIAGSSNFDYLSYRLYQEIVAIFTGRQVIDEFRERVMLPDLAAATPVECHASEIGRRWLNWQTKLIDVAVSALT
ncbi:MAG TPA: phosphatidylserine/phosphatidylglycerophosphate/cardiolipin synthase family protein [Pyrinomonadaceae bacterium]|nr:phosphatidylserine/phosphatidylglycerophosphate/cardiolipin synthase family protein [Pyrinomonadaceae bacterium]